ncbi:hypothetical protein MKW98_025419 [Papaver atlanticum]|uniref:DUF7086 domain-containing protein n=1 Tax=Papaver atlanticum TaxID=357466 RepID=A0AAD4SCU9_9MAGN|nr:hypothetical protein MKW98_025419 [Papaver atlanticum]
MDEDKEKPMSHREINEEDIKLTLFTQPPSSPLPVVSHHHHLHQQQDNSHIINTILPSRIPPARPKSRVMRRTKGRDKMKNTPIVPPYEWATNQRANIHTLDYLLSRNMKRISGDVQCKKCSIVCNIEFDLEAKFMEISQYIAVHKESLRDRAPEHWMNSKLPSCGSCSQANSLKPLLNQKKKEINWLFLFLGQMIGCCSLAQLKYYCKYTDNHRTGAKDRLVFLAYLGICHQLQPADPTFRLGL